MNGRRIVRYRQHSVSQVVRIGDSLIHGMSTWENVQGHRRAALHLIGSESDSSVWPDVAIAGSEPQSQHDAVAQSPAGTDSFGRRLANRGRFAESPRGRTTQGRQFSGRHADRQDWRRYPFLCQPGPKTSLTELPAYKSEP